MGIQQRQAVLFLGMTVGLAYWAMWTIGAQNNLLPEIEAICRLRKGTDPVYTSNEKLNGVICVLVTFLNTAIQHPHAGPLLTFFLSILGVPVLISHLLASYNETPTLLRISPLATAAAAQLLGAGIAYPSWYCFAIMFSRWNELAPKDAVVKPVTPQAKVMEVKRIRSLFPALLVALYLPCFLMVDPFDKLSPETKHAANFAFQVFPVTLGLARTIFQAVLPSDGTAASAQKQSLSMAAVLSTVLWWFTLFQTYELARASGSLVNTLHSLFYHPVYPETIQEKALLFLAFDLVAVAVSTLVYLAHKLSNASDVGASKLLVVLIWAPFVGPAAMFLWAYGEATSDEAKKALVMQRVAEVLAEKEAGAKEPVVAAAKSKGRKKA